MQVQDSLDKMISWFEAEIEESMAWTEADITDQRKREIAEYKALNLIDHVMNNAPYKPW